MPGRRTVTDPLRGAVMLLRPGLCAMVTLSALAGGMLAPGPPRGQDLILLACGVFLLACGASVLNQVQERHTDALMRRTRLRPLACGRLKAPAGLIMALALAAGGALSLGNLGAVPLLFGGTALVSYNALYTPLKRRSSLSLLPGALCGALPPLIGWTAAGMSPLDIRILLLAALLFLWQIPHFCALAQRHRDDYRRAGLCTPPARRGIVLVWVLALGVLTAQCAAFGLLRIPAAIPLLLVFFFWLLPPLARAFDLQGPSRRLEVRLQLFLAVLLTSIVFSGIVPL